MEFKATHLEAEHEAPRSHWLKVMVRPGVIYGNRDGEAMRLYYRRGGRWYMDCGDLQQPIEAPPVLSRIRSE